MKRSALLFSLVALAVIASKVLIEDLAGVDLESAVNTWMANAGTGSALLIVLLLAADVFLPVPSSLVMVISGAAFGVPWGSALALVGSVAGEWLGFEIVRRFGRAASSRLVGDDELVRLNRFFERHGAASIVVTRPLPIIMETMSIVAGLSRMTRSSFLLASVAGTAPIVVVYAYAGAVSRQVGSLLPAVVILIGVAGLAFVTYRARFTPVPSSEASLGSPRADRTP
jgi:uncharacterized membrane protein YdjX (TVP38/TMEM64 family)